MRTTKIIFRLLLIGLVFSGAMGLQSCTEDFEEINTDPALAPSLKPEFTLAWSQVSVSGHRFEMWRAHLLGAGIYAQHIGTHWYGYTQANDGWIEAYWNTAYAKLVGNINLTIDLAQEQGDQEKVAIARIWRAFIFHRLTDYWGDIPYSQAGLPADEAVLTPAYDTQEAIYMDMLNELKEAADVLSPGGNSYGEGDLVYQGDHDKWIRFANSLRLRLAMRISNVDPSTAEQHMREALAGGVFQSNEDNTIMIHDEAEQFDLQSNGSSAPIVAGFNGHYVAKAVVDLLSSTNDPRLPVFAETTVDGSYVGLPNGLPSDYPNGAVGPDNYSLPNRSTLFGMGSDVTFVSYAEVLFLQAEAALKGWDSGSPQAYYEAGVRASMEQFGAEGDVDAYLAQAGVAYDAANAMEQIITQKWIAVFPDSWEAWSEWRRTGYPAFTNEMATDVESIPMRMKYPQIEQVLNTDNYNQAVSNQGPDVEMTRVWWDN